jgi:hypothetical protein
VADEQVGHVGESPQERLGQVANVAGEGGGTPQGSGSRASMAK